jgi:hypothetical protein
MSTSLYDLSVGCYLQTLGGIAGCLERGAKYFAEKGIDPNEIVETRLFADMLPFRFQVQSVAHHSLGTMEAIKAGTFLPPNNMPAHDYKGLQALIADTTAALKKLSPADVNAQSGKDLIFQMRDFKLPFTAENFVMSFSLPNFHFHATTTYDILRTKGVPLGKRDYLGQMRMKGMA